MPDQPVLPTCALQTTHFYSRPTLGQLKCIPRDLKQAASQCGRELHPDKTHVLTNMSWRQGRT
eukprot:7232004-Pyramimonas_sp.AAC.1